MVISKKKQTLNVFMNGILVGKLECFGGGGLKFQYVKTWRESQGARPISLSLPLAAESFEGARVYNFFDNLLPDNPQIRARIQAQFHVPTDQPFDLLANIGRDCVGAIQICENPGDNIKQIKARPVNKKEIAKLLKNYREMPLGMTLSEQDFRISIAGVQEKTAFLLHQRKWWRPLGTTPTTHIFKLPIGYLEHQQLDLSDSCENEWLCSQIAKAYGLQVAECVIKQFDDVKVLVTKRFDRKWSDDGKWIIRLPQEDLCQAMGYSPNLKYQADGGPGIKNIMSLLLGSVQPSVNRNLFFRSQVLFWLLAAIDGHAKNFSIFIKPWGRYELTPLYDILSAYPLLKKRQLQKQKIKMAMALEGKNKHYRWDSVQHRHFLSTAKAANYSLQEAEDILDSMLMQLDEVIDTVNNNLPDDFPSDVAESIFASMRDTRDRFIKKN